MYRGLLEVLSRPCISPFLQCLRHPCMCTTAMNMDPPDTLCQGVSLSAKNAALGPEREPKGGSQLEIR